MTSHVDLAASLLRARARRAVAQALDALSKEDARAILLDVYAELEIESGDARPHEQPAPPPSVSEPPPREKAEGTYSDRLLRTLTANPRMSITDLSIAVYGISDSGTRSKTRSLLSALKGRGEVDNVGEGEWEVVKKEAMKQKS